MLNYPFYNAYCELCTVYINPIFTITLRRKDYYSYLEENWGMYYMTSPSTTSGKRESWIGIVF